MDVNKYLAVCIYFPGVLHRNPKNCQHYKGVKPDVARGNLTITYDYMKDYENKTGNHAILLRTAKTLLTVIDSTINIGIRHLNFIPRPYEEDTWLSSNSIDGLNPI